MFVVTVKWFHRSIFGSYMGSSKMKKKTMNSDSDSVGGSTGSLQTMIILASGSSPAGPGRGPAGHLVNSEKILEFTVLVHLY